MLGQCCFTTRIEKQYKASSCSICCIGCAISWKKIKAIQCVACFNGFGCGKYESDEEETSEGWFCQLLGCCTGYGFK
jgi:hypothetical protein